MNSWEYKILLQYDKWFFSLKESPRSLDEFLTENEGKEVGCLFDILDDIGKEGWELVNIVPHPFLGRMYFYVFKRQDKINEN